jgi:hypothetical protein
MSQVLGRTKDVLMRRGGFSHTPTSRASAGRRTSCKEGVILSIPPTIDVTNRIDTPGSSIWKSLTVYRRRQHGGGCSFVVASDRVMTLCSVGYGLVVALLERWFITHRNLGRDINAAGEHSVLFRNRVSAR